MVQTYTRDIGGRTLTIEWGKLAGLAGANVHFIAPSRPGFGYTSPSEEDVPLREWIREHVGEEAIKPRRPA